MLFPIFFCCFPMFHHCARRNEFHFGFRAFPGLFGYHIRVNGHRAGVEGRRVRSVERGKDDEVSSRIDCFDISRFLPLLPSRSYRNQRHFQRRRPIRLQLRRRAACDLRLPFIFWVASFVPRRSILGPRPQVTRHPISRLRL